ncbi:hypothetical protein QFC19_008834 [Naganishia cerealis]|uniref:Uncharacterized protein n=1 Tax=Naganishia cerealis TaxID=610337 RepID=A0ACC2UYU9_9TREE|nr:hypothetical protein QFC19_008834 [Naganishia cerealis]
MARKSKAKDKKWVAPPEPVRVWLPSTPAPHNEDSLRNDHSDLQRVNNCIASEIQQFFHYLTTSSGSAGGGATAARPGKGQWTVVAGFVALEEDFQDKVDDGIVRSGSSNAVDNKKRFDHVSSSLGPTDNSIYQPNMSSAESEPALGPHGLGHSPLEQRAAVPAGKWVNLKVCSIASGVKCLGNLNSDSHVAVNPEEQPPQEVLSPSRSSPCSWTERDSVVFDMHAEILARRELECLLMREMRVLLQRERRRRSNAAQDHRDNVPERVEGIPYSNLSSDERSEEEDIDPILLELRYLPRHDRHTDGKHSQPSDTTAVLSVSARNTHLPPQPARPCFRLKSSVQLYLYTSHAPCGAASDASHLRRLDAEDQSIYQLLSQFDFLTTSFKALTKEPERTAAPPMSSFRQSKSLDIPPICKKPSRADAPPTTAFSCSDKLGRWQWLGFQGGRLARMFESPPYSIPVGKQELIDAISEKILPSDHNDHHSHQSSNQQIYVGYPIRLSGLVVGEDFESACLHKIFGNGEPVDTGDDTYSRIRNGTQEVLAQRGESSGKQWLTGLIESAGCSIGESTLLFPYGRAVATNTSGEPTLPALPADADISKLHTLAMPLLRDILLPTPSFSPMPFPVALSYHAFSSPQALGPNGRLSGVTRDKRTKQWGDNSVARVARGRMWDAYERVVEDYEECFGDLERRKVARRKKGKGWSEAAQWMEERGPYAGWHRTSLE